MLISTASSSLPATASRKGAGRQDERKDPLPAACKGEIPAAPIEFDRGISATGDVPWKLRLNPWFDMSLKLLKLPKPRSEANISREEVLCGSEMSRCGFGSCARSHVTSYVTDRNSFSLGSDLFGTTKAIFFSTSQNSAAAKRVLQQAVKTPRDMSVLIIA
eukprot:2392920-Rhodomonas_salina.2